MTHVDVTGFLNSDTAEDSLGRLGQAALDSGISDAALRSLVKLTCLAHDIKIAGLDMHNVEEAHLKEMKSIGIIHRPKTGEVKMV